MGDVNKKFKTGSPEHEAAKARQRKWYTNNIIAQRKAANDRVKIKRGLNQQWIINYLYEEECRACGLNDIRLLTFNHLNPSLKHANIADLVSKGAKLSKVIDEVKKCEVLCHNCHMLETFKQLGGSYRETMRPISDFDLKDYIRQVTGK